MTITSDGIKITTRAETLPRLRSLSCILDVVILADSALREGDVTLTQLKITAAQRRRGAPMLRQVIPLLDQRSESAWESVMRVLHLVADIPVEPQYEIFDEFGRFVARVDPLIKGRRRIHEYDGGVHREVETHQGSQA